MEVRPVGEHAVLVDCATQAEVIATYDLLRSRADALGAVEVVPAARTVLLDGLVDAEHTAAEIAAWPVPQPRPVAAAEEVRIPVRYDGPDLPEVARQWHVSVDDVVALHRESTFTVAFCGFAPGFAYLTGLPEGRTVMRRAEPRPQVPAGSVAIAGEYTGVYPQASPGGWQLIGRTEVRLWRPELAVPALLAPGTRVRFVGV